MSVLRNRILAHDGGQQGHAGGHPHGTAATPMVMPLATVDYVGEQAIYGTAAPLITADGAVIAGRTPRAHNSPHAAPVVPAGRR